MGSIRQRSWCADGRGVPWNDLGNPEEAKHGSERNADLQANRFTSSTLPGIYEVFCRRSMKTGQETSPLANLIPLSLFKNHFQIPDSVLKVLPQEQKHQQHMAPAPKSGSFTAPTASISNQPTRDAVGHRPTAQLPPIAHLSKETKDQAIQHQEPIGDFPALEEVLSHYINRGRLFRCQHCDILFFERGMFFLHSSLHGTGNPWKCSICHKVCLNKNEFTLHFVNQQHGI